MVIPVLSVFLLMIAFVCKQDKKCFWILWAFMVVVICCNTYNNVDWDAYKFMYSIIQSLNNITLTDVGYGFLNYIGNEYLRLDFFQFRAMFTFVGMLLLGKVILKYSSYPALVLALYFVAPFFPNDIIQIRNFMAQVILGFFLAEWIESNKRNIFGYIVGVLLATTMHSSFVYFIIFLVLYFVKEDKKLYLGIGGVTFFIGFLPGILKQIPFISSQKIAFYLGEVSQGIDARGLLIILVIFSQTYILYYIYKYSQKTDNSRLIYWSEIVYKMNILCLPACAIMLVWSFSFYRIPRNMLLLNYIVYAMYLREKERKGFINMLTVISIFQGLLWSAVNSFSQWSVIWSNNALFKW